MANNLLGILTKAERYNRVKDKEKFDKNYQDIKWKTAVTPSLGRKFKKTY